MNIVSILVSVISATCLLILCIVLKNILFVPPYQLNQDIIIWIIIFTGFGASYPLISRKSSEKKREMVLIWCILIVVTMTGVIGIYAL